MTDFRQRLLGAAASLALLGSASEPARPLVSASGSSGLPAELQDAEQEQEWSYHDAAEIGLEGRGWKDAESQYDRLPARAKELVRDKVWQLSQQSSGLFVSFVTDATRMRFEVELTKEQLDMPHMPAAGVSGVDLYARDDSGTWRWVAASRPNARSFVAKVDGLRPESREYRLYLPLYNGVRSLRIGVPEDAAFEGVVPRTARPIVYYGTSIAQGACASRPGMSFVNQLGRRLDVPMINLGFSGNGRLEIEVAGLIAELDASLFVLDCLPNLGPAQVAERTGPVVRLLREKHPETPIVLVEDRANANAAFFPGREAFHQKNHEALRKCYADLLAEGVTGLTYIADAPFLGEDGEATVDGSHPTDLGMVRYADALEPWLRALLAE